MIKKEDLHIGWYKGKGRNSNVAYWTGKTFLTIGRRFDNYNIKVEGHYDDGGCFQPKILIELDKTRDWKISEKYKVVIVSNPYILEEVKP